MFLEEMVAIKRQEISQRKPRSCLKEMEEAVSHLPPARNFAEAILQYGPVALIAEIKPASPSAGFIREDADIARIARQYQAGGARAISVLTEAHFFRGDRDHLRQVRAVVSLPLLQKDFIIDSLQVYEGRLAGADALLLIAAILDPSPLAELAELARRLGMVPLVEIHDEEDLGKIAGLPLRLIGINNRNLRTLEVNLDTTFRLIEKVPAGTTVISESGIKSRQDVRRLQRAGVKGILVGEILMRAADPAAKIRELLEL